MGLEYIQLFADMEALFEPYNDAQRGRLIMAMMGYAYRSAEPEFEGAEKFIWPVLRQHIDRCAASVEAKKAAGIRGGRAIRSRSEGRQENAQESGRRQEKAEESRGKQGKAEESESRQNAHTQDHDQDQDHDQEQEQEHGGAGAAVDAGGVRGGADGETAAAAAKGDGYACASGGTGAQSGAAGLKSAAKGDGGAEAAAAKGDEYACASGGTGAQDCAGEEAQADALLRAYALSPACREDLLDDIRAHGLEKMQRVLREAARADTRGGLSVNFYRRVLESDGKPRSEKGGGTGDKMLRYSPQERRAAYSAAVLDFDD